VLTHQDLTRLLEQSPFVPFRLHLTSGQAFEVRHPEFVWVFRNYLPLAVPTPEKSKLMDRQEYISLLHILRIEQLPVAA
jgi:hypothetical protein